ncbi:FAD-dependent oxidoreductase [Pararhodobacter aggregans]|nr:FAD-dependent oxidoreductase [Pararhodobacter aggregans]PTW99938.1 ferredoxin--NADP+ reductase [Pararhodobacter aggregans]
MHQIAIIGAGPSGCFTAQALAKLMPGARIDLIDALPVPYGLIRYGVAPDHQGTKAVIRQFERLFERQGVGFFGHVRLGETVTLEALQGLYDAVVLATGLSVDRRLGVKGDDLPGVLGSGAVTRAFNDYPDTAPVAIGEQVVIVGNGNVAADLVRLLAKGAGEFHGSDLSETAARQCSDVRRIDVVGRSPSDQAKFDPVMIRELGRLEQAAIHVHGLSGEGKIVEALQHLEGHDPQDATREIHFHFGWTPEVIEGTDRVTAARFRQGDARLVLPCDTVLTAIGFEGERPAADAEGAIAPGLYATGWLKRGPRGTIPENRADAQNVAARIAADLADVAPGKAGRDGVLALVPGAVHYDHWQRIDAAERADCPEGRVRRKIPTTARMLAIAHQTGES